MPDDLARHLEQLRDHYLHAMWDGERDAAALYEFDIQRAERLQTCDDDEQP